MSLLFIFWLLSAVILLTASRRMWIDNDFDNRFLCIIMCCVWPLVVGWSLIDGVRALVRKFF